MLGYVMLGTNDVPRAKAFYEPIMALLGASQVEAYTSDKRVWYGIKGAPGMLVITLPNDGAPATSGNGTMIALPGPSHEIIGQAHALAMAAGGTDEGAPGLRGEYFYGAYFRDPDGNMICLFKA